MEENADELEVKLSLEGHMRVHWNLSLPLGVPKDLFPRLARFHGDPSAWWNGQLISYLTRYQPSTAQFIKATQERIGLFKKNNPAIVGYCIYFLKSYIYCYVIYINGIPEYT
jgi:hypothetical protein